MSDFNPSTSRRSFLKAGVLAGAGAFASGALGACAAAVPDGTQSISLQEEEIAWDAVYDVVVIGFGAAGASAALSAAESGASVLLVDKAPEGREGGNSRFSSQLFLSADDEKGALQYLQALRGDYYAPDEILESYAAGLCSIRGILAEWGLDESEVVDVTDFDLVEFKSQEP